MCPSPLLVESRSARYWGASMSRVLGDLASIDQVQDHHNSLIARDEVQVEAARRRRPANRRSGATARAAPSELGWETAESTPLHPPTFPTQGRVLLFPEKEF